MAPHQKPSDVAANIAAELKDPNAIYIDSPAYFEEYFAPIYFDEKTQASNSVPGDLQKVIQEGGTVIVNWSNFSSTAMAANQCVIDRPKPNFFNRLLSNKTRVIGLSLPTTEACESFLSRCDKYKLPQNAGDMSATLKPLTPEEIKFATVIDLENNPCWRDQVFPVKLVNGKATLGKDIFSTVDAKNPIIIFKNAPADRDLHLLIDSINQQHRYLHNDPNGHFTPAGKLRVVLDPTPMLNAAELKIELEDAKTLFQKRLIFIGAHNVDDCIKRLKLDDKKALSMKPGLLHDYDEKTDVFYLTETLATEDASQLANEIKKSYPNKQFRFIQGAHASEKTSYPTVFFTNDTNHLTRKMWQDTKDALIIHLNKESCFEDLFYEITKDKDKLQFVCHEPEDGYLKALRTKRPIIFTGEPSERLYQQLLSLVSEKPYIDCAGQRIPLMEGQVKVVLPARLKNQYPLIGRVSYQDQIYDDQYYLKLFPTESVAVKQIQQFFKCVEKLPPGKMGFQRTPDLTAARLNHLLQVLHDTKLHPHNPIKGLLRLHYGKHGEESAYLNVIGKSIFRKEDKASFRALKLKDLLSEHKIKRENLSQYAWRILNCYNGYQINQILQNNLDMEIPSATLDKLWQMISLDQDAKHVVKVASETLKRTHQFKTHLQDAEPKVIVIKGSPGSGKTEEVKKLIETKEFAVYRIDADGVPLTADQKKCIKQFLSDRSDKTKILFVDEFNKSLPGTFDFLTSVCNGEKEVGFEGEIIPIVGKLKMVATCNPDSFPGRYVHPFLEEYGHVLYFTLPRDADLKKMLQAKLATSITNEQYDQILAAFHLICKSNPLFIYSIRDLDYIANMIKATKASPFSVCMMKFALTIADVTKRKTFITELHRLFSMPVAPEAEGLPIKLELIKSETESLFIPKSKMVVVNIIEQSLEIRNKAVNVEERGILIQGEAGIGKSSLIRIKLENKGLSRDAENPLMKYYEVSAGNRDTYKDILVAAKEGSAVIFNEPNLDEEADAVLNYCLTHDVHPKFRIYCLLNPGHYAGRKSIPESLLNRMHVVYFDSYTKEELIAFAKQKNIPHSEDLVEVLINLKVNQRDIFDIFTQYEVLANKLDHKSMMFKAPDKDLHALNKQLVDILVRARAEQQDPVIIGHLLKLNMYVMHYKIDDPKQMRDSAVNLIDEIRKFTNNPKYINIDVLKTSLSLSAAAMEGEILKLERSHSLPTFRLRGD